MFETLLLETDARGVATLTLGRPDKHNALNSQMMSELSQAAIQLASDDGVRVVVLTGTGASFCAGGDLGWMRAQFEASPVERAKEARKLAHMLRDLDHLPKPLIGRIQGQAFGGGIGMMSVCDVAIGVEGATFGLTETRLGLVPATISPYVIARMGAARARQVFMSGARFDATQARDLGLLADVVAPEELDAAIVAEVKPYLSAAPGAVARAKQLIRDIGGTVGDAQIEETVQVLVETWEGQEAQDGIAAFFDRQPAPWVVK